MILCPACEADMLPAGPFPGDPDDITPTPAECPACGTVQ